VRTEKRHAQRKVVALRAIITCDEANPFRANVSAQTLDLSSTGALIESPERMFPEDVCTFRLVTNDGHRAEVQGRIVWVAQNPGGDYRAGVAFRNITPDAQYLLDLQLVRSAQSKT